MNSDFEFWNSLLRIRKIKLFEKKDFLIIRIQPSNVRVLVFYNTEQCPHDSWPEIDSMFSRIIEYFELIFISSQRKRFEYSLKTTCTSIQIFSSLPSFMLCSSTAKVCFEFPITLSLWKQRLAIKYN